MRNARPLFLTRDGPKEREEVVRKQDQEGGFVSLSNKAEAAFLSMGAAFFLSSAAGKERVDPKRSPILQVPLMKIDFGEVKARTGLTQELIVHNIRKGASEILRVQSGCGYTVTDYDPATPPSGRGAQLDRKG